MNFSWIRFLGALVGAVVISFILKFYTGIPVDIAVLAFSFAVIGLQTKNAFSEEKMTLEDFLKKTFKVFCTIAIFLLFRHIMSMLGFPIQMSVSVLLLELHGQSILGIGVETKLFGFLLDIGMLGLGLAIGAEWPMVNHIQKYLISMYGWFITIGIIGITLYQLKFFIPDYILAKFSGYAGRFWSLLNATLPAPEKISFSTIATTLAIILITVAVVAISRSKKSGAIWGFLIAAAFIIVVAAGLKAWTDFYNNRGKPRIVPETMASSPEGIKQYSFDVPAHEGVNTYKYSETGYLKVEAEGDLTGSLGKNGPRWKINSGHPFETHNAPIGQYVFLRNDSDRSVRVSIK